MDTFTIVLLGWGLYSVIHYFEKRGERGKAIIATVLVSLLIILSNVFSNFANASQLGWSKLVLTVCGECGNFILLYFSASYFQNKKIG